MAEERQVLKTIEDRVFEQAAGVVEAALMFAECADGEEPWAEWVEKYGLKQARIKHRIAQAARLNSREAPFGLRLATSVTIGAMKSRALRDAAPTLNMQLVQITGGGPQFDELIIPGEEKIKIPGQ